MQKVISESQQSYPKLEKGSYQFIDTESSENQSMSSVSTIKQNPRRKWNCCKINLDPLRSFNKNIIAIFALHNFIEGLKRAKENFSGALILLIFQNLIKNEADKDQLQGASILTNLRYYLTNCGGIISAIIAAISTKYLGTSNSYWIICALIIIQLIVFIFFSYYMKRQSLTKQTMETLIDDKDKVENFDKNSNIKNNNSINITSINQRTNILKNPKRQTKRTFCQKIQMLREIYLTLAFIFIHAILSPSYAPFESRFSSQVLGYSNTTICLLAIIGYIIAIQGTFYVQKWFNNSEPRNLVLIFQLAKLVSLFLNYIQNMRWNVGILPDIVYTIGISFLADPIYATFYDVALQIIYMKLSPSRYQTSMGALYLSFAIVSQSFVSTPVALALNTQFTQVDKNNIEDIYKLKYIQMIFCVAVIPFTFLLPNFDRLNRFNSALAELELDQVADQPISASDLKFQNHNSWYVGGTLGESSFETFQIDRKSVEQNIKLRLRKSQRQQSTQNQI
ncbi:UNKNOWN [Stylonychia lemnae]|uniref:Transmembrane protein n=1 Tax=Stylonychia lemnae TaxID=5949 RepID=A0A078AFI8_STYLE|nr:UNKNOWN [Stylonychia lemnae]|eukprot:CDW80965.1 UNKNOWN [Stylonychia lemnae]